MSTISLRAARCVARFPQRRFSVAARGEGVGVDELSARRRRAGAGAGRRGVFDVIAMAREADAIFKAQQAMETESCFVCEGGQGEERGAAGQAQ